MGVFLWWISTQFCKTGPKELASSRKEFFWNTLLILLLLLSIPCWELKVYDPGNTSAKLAHCSMHCRTGHSQFWGLFDLKPAAKRARQIKLLNYRPKEINLSQVQDIFTDHIHFMPWNPLPKNTFCPCISKSFVSSRGNNIECIADLLSWAIWPSGAEDTWWGHKGLQITLPEGGGGGGGGRGSLAYEILRSWEDLDVKLCSNHWIRGNMWVDMS